MSVLETFLINGRRYSIESCQPKSFGIYYTSTAIGQSTSLDDARKLLHAYAVSQTNAEYHGYQERMASAQRAVQKLGTDPFNLRIFREHAAAVIADERTK